MTTFLERADAEMRRLATKDGRFQCVAAASLARALWPDSPGWHRVSNVGRGATTGVGPKRAAGGVLKRLVDADAATHCPGHLSGDYCYGYRPKGKPLKERK